MDKKLWTNHFWATFHYIALGYPDNPSPQDKLNYKNFFEYFGIVLPCNDCVTHYKEFFKNKPIDNYLDSPNNLFEWTVIFHNNVNKFTNHKQFTVEETKKYYLNRSNFNYNKILLLILFSFIFLIISYKYIKN
jgi:hypothetical protein